MLENNKFNQEDLSYRDNHHAFLKGQKLKIELENGTTSEHTIINVLDSKKAGDAIGLIFNINKPIPIIILDKTIVGGVAQYHPEMNVIFAYNDTSPEVMTHEIIHSIEIQKPVSVELERFYEKILKEMPDTNNLQPNFRKNIHEFVADAYSKEGFIETLKNKGLYDEFEKVTKYIFE